MKINIYHASQLGMAEEAGENLGDYLTAQDHDVAVNDLNGIDPGDLSHEALNIFISSTTGSGQVPDNGWFFMDVLEQQKPDLSNLNFAIFGLGDTGYEETYNMGSELMMAALKSCGAKQIGERGLHDASGDEDVDDAIEVWTRGIVALYS